VEYSQWECRETEAGKWLRDQEKYNSCAGPNKGGHCEKEWIKDKAQKSRHTDQIIREVTQIELHPTFSLLSQWL
jgi:hypothetical protein